MIPAGVETRIPSQTNFFIMTFFLLTIHVFKIVGTKIYFKYLFRRFLKDNYRAQRLVFLDIFSRE